MSRLPQTLTGEAYGNGVKGGLINLSVQGQQGYITDLATSPSSTDYVKQPAIVKVLRPPMGLLMMPNPRAYIAAYKNMIESWMQSWDGFNQTMSVSKNDTETGRAGDTFETPTRVSRAQSNITSTLVEKARRPFQRLLEDITRYTIADPTVGHPLLSNFNENFTDRLSDIYGAIWLVYEPDVTFKYVERAWLYTNVWLHGEIGENTASRQLQQDGEVPTYNLNWTSFQKVGHEIGRAHV